MLIVSILVIIVAYCALIAGPQSSPENSAYNRGYGEDSDTVDTLVSRIEWSNHYKSRIHLVHRFVVFSFIIGVVVITCIQNRIPSGIDLARFVFICTVMSLALNKYITHHGEKFPHYAIDRNVKLLRKKLGLQKNLPTRNLQIFPNTSECWNFVFSTSSIKDHS
jgi:hypothetical protein